MATPPDWATHEALFCGVVPVWFADKEPEGCVLVGRGWFADSILFPVVQTLFQLGAAIFDWEVFPIQLVRPIPKTKPAESDR